MRQQMEAVSFEAVVPSASGQSLLAPEVSLAAGEDLARLMAPAERARRAANVLQDLGFAVRHIGDFSISCEGSPDRFQAVFGTTVERRTQALSSTQDGGEISYFGAPDEAPFSLPTTLEGLVERAYPQPPPIFFASPLPPRVGYHHLRVPSDIALVLRATGVHKQGVSGRGVLVAMVDTGFYTHPYYVWHGYHYQATLAPDAVAVEHDENGHGTAEAANIFAVAPDIDFVGVKMGANATLAFKTASDLYPAVLTNSWGYDLSGATSVPAYLKPLEAAVVQAVQERGITVCFSGGNGHVSFPGMMPDVLSVGGVYADEFIEAEDFKLVASDYASSFDSAIYPGRHVPDLCGLVGLKPRGIYIMLPVEPGDEIDAGLGGGSFPDADETATGDGWAVISGTSAASPQLAGVCALLKQVQPGLAPALVKAVLRASARDVKEGESAQGQPAGEGHDGATGAGLVDAYAAYLLARSSTPRSTQMLPPPA